jgi:hypothetical protein
VAEASKEQPVEIRLTRTQAIAAGAVLRGYVQHQRERLGDQAATNPNFQHVSAALRAIEEQLGGEPGAAPADPARQKRGGGAAP